MPPEDTARFLADSPDRLRLLAHLEEHPGTPATLSDELSMARRSVQRNLGEFADRGWVEKRAGTYHLTTMGALVADRHGEYLEALAVLEEFEPFVAELPDREHAPDPQHLRGASLTVATPENPQAPVHEYVSRLDAFEADRIRMLSPVLSRLFHEAHAELALRGVHTELIMSEAMIDRARELNPAEFTVVVTVGVLDLYRYPDEIGLGLTIGDDRLLAGAYDADGHLAACLESTDAAVVAWADDLFDRYRNRAERVEPTDSFPFG